MFTGVITLDNNKKTSNIPQEGGKFSYSNSKGDYSIFFNEVLVLQFTEEEKNYLQPEEKTEIGKYVMVFIGVIITGTIVTKYYIGKNKDVGVKV